MLLPFLRPSWEITVDHSLLGYLRHHRRHRPPLPRHHLLLHRPPPLHPRHLQRRPYLHLLRLVSRHS